MSKQIYKSINNTLDFYQNYILNPKPHENVHLVMFPNLRELTLNKIEILNKLLELIGDKDDNYYHEFYNNYFKDFKLKQIYTLDRGLLKFNSFTDITDFIRKISAYEWIDGKILMNEIND